MSLEIRGLGIRFSQVAFGNSKTSLSFLRKAKSSIFPRLRVVELRIERLALVLERGDIARQRLNRSVFLVDFVLENSDYRFVVRDISDSSGFLLGESKVVLVYFLCDECDRLWLERGRFGCDGVLFGKP